MNPARSEQDRLAKERKSRVFLFLEIVTVAAALAAYLIVFRPRERRDAQNEATFTHGRAALDAGNFIEARKAFVSTLDYAQSQKKSDLAVATSQDHLADADRGLEDFEDAIPLDERAQPVFEKYQSRWEGLYADFLVKFAGSYEQVGRYGEAETFLKKALLLKEKTFGPDALPLATTLDAMAYFYYDWDHDEIAEPLAKRSLAICESRAGVNEPQTALASSMLGLVYDGEGKFTEAERLERGSLPIIEARFGPRSYEAASALNRLGLALEGQRRWGEAEAAFSQALSIRQERSGAQSQGLVVILRNLSRVYAEQQRKNDAAAARQRADEISANHHRVRGLSEETGSAAQTTPHSEAWQTYRNEQGNFSVLLPAEPKILSANSIQAKSGASTYTVAYYDVDPGTTVDEAGFRNFQATVLRSLRAKADCDEVNIIDPPSPEFIGYLGSTLSLNCRVRSEQWRVSGNLYFGPQHMYVVFAMFPTTPVVPPDAERFKNSFSLIDASK